jgi:hypothetical protein
MADRFHFLRVAWGKGIPFFEERAIAEQGVMSGKPLIESDRVEGTTVYDPQGNKIGSIKRA